MLQNSDELQNYYRYEIWKYNPYLQGWMQSDKFTVAM